MRPGRVDDKIGYMSEINETKLNVIDGNRVDLERELLESIFRGERNDPVLARLEPRLSKSGLEVISGCSTDSSELAAPRLSDEAPT